MRERTRSVPNTSLVRVRTPKYCASVYPLKTSTDCPGVNASSLGPDAWLTKRGVDLALTKLNGSTHCPCVSARTLCPGAWLKKGCSQALTKLLCEHALSRCVCQETLSKRAASTQKVHGHVQYHCPSEPETSIAIALACAASAFARTCPAS